MGSATGRSAVAVAFLALSLACQRRGAPGDDAPEAGAAPASNGGADTTVAPPLAFDTTRIARLEEAFLTPRDTLDDVDSPAVYHGEGDRHWLLSTAKSTDVVIVDDAATGAAVRRLGGTGAAPGQLDRPNGIAVIDDLLLVVERDNARLQAFSLPELTSLGTFGEEQLRRPYGIAAYREDDGRVAAYITDNYELVEDQIPPDSALGERVEQFRVWREDGRLRTEHVRTFGDTSGAGVLRKVETIGVDPEQGRLLIAEELPPDSHFKIYTLDGRFSGESFGNGFFPQEAEGVALYACTDGGGYWLATDQGMERNTFHVFDRKTLDYIGSFSGNVTRNTDGVALTQQGYGRFPSGAFFAVHNDGNVAAFSWADIAGALELRRDCSTAPATAAD